MIEGIVDTTVLIHVIRGDRNAVAWLRTLPHLGVTPISWMELVYGARGKRGQVESLKLLNTLQLLYLTQADQDWAMQQLLGYRLSHGVATEDCLIASVCHRLQVPLYTHNLKDMLRLLGPNLVIKPY